MASDPMTLAEFQKHAAAQMALYVGGIMDMDETEREFRLLGLRLLAGERLRCKALSDAVRTDLNANGPRCACGNGRMPTTAYRDACDAFAAAIDKLGDPTP